MIIQVHIGDTVVGALADGRLLRQIPSFAPSEVGFHTLDTSELPEDLRLQVEEEVRGLFLEEPRVAE